MHFLKYLSVGIVNTFIGFGVFLLLIGRLELRPEIANFIGYVVALIIAYSLNKIYVFNDFVAAPGAIFKFFLCFICSFLINQCVLILFYRIMDFNAAIAQIPAMASYTLVFYFLNKTFVFSRT